MSSLTRRWIEPKLDAMKALLILLLTVNVLTCPLRCLSCDAISAVRGENVPVTACVCCHSESSPGSEAPVPGEEPCNCQDCFCDGALVEYGQAIGVTVQETWLLACVDLDLQFGKPPIVEFDQRNCNSGHGRFSCGRVARIGLQSLLI